MEARKRHAGGAKRRARLVLLGLLGTLCAGCQFLQNEFSALNRIPPSAHAEPPAQQPW
ncbi:MAG TPA: hypothetical protein VK081_13065 [Planctomycetota bacterium]|nr:hypothetical protein [Planctomycetota bacterium]